MQLKWLEDFVALAQERSFTRAAELRHVTHPAFGRRIRALESWAGTPLIEREAGPVKLTAAGQAFLDTALQMTRHLAQSHDELMAIAGRQGRTVTLCTGRTLARTIVADWLVRLRPYLADGELRISTRSLADAVHDLQHGLADFSILYHHPSLVVPGSGLVKAQAEAEGLHTIFLEAGFEWREPGCSMCLAMNPDKLGDGEHCASTSNRNFEGRQGSGGRTHLVSPAMAAAAAVAGHFVDVRDLMEA